MPKTKEPIKRSAKTVKTPAQETTKKVTLDDLQAIIADIGKSQDEAWKAIRET